MMKQYRAGGHVYMLLMDFSGSVSVGDDVDSPLDSMSLTELIVCVENSGFDRIFTQLV